MIQTTLVILLVAAAACWALRALIRFFVPAKGQTTCGGSCGCGHETDPIKTPAPAPKTVFFPAEDLARRAAARKA